MNNASYVTAIKNLILLFAITVVHILRFIIVGIMRGFTNYHAANSTMAWCRSLVKNLNITVEMKGKLLSQGVLFVSNHRSYIDVAVAG